MDTPRTPSLPCVPEWPDQTPRSEKDPAMTLRSLLPVLMLTAAALVIPSVASAADGFTRSTTSLRAGPGADYPRVARVGGGTSLEIFGCLARGSWCDVGVDGERGWLPGRRIDFVESGRRTHLSGHFSSLGLSILSFGRNDYWGEHYAGRPWVNDRNRKRGPVGDAPPIPVRPSAAERPQPPHAPPVGPPRGNPAAERPPARDVHPAPSLPPRAETVRPPAAPHSAPAPHEARAPRAAPPPHPAPQGTPPHRAPAGKPVDVPPIRPVPGVTP